MQANQQGKWQQFLLTFVRIHSHCLLTALLLLLLLVVCPQGYAENFANVLMLNSYHIGFKWSDEIGEGVTSILNSEELEVKLFIEHLDSKRIYSQPAFDRLAELIEEKYRHTTIDTVIVADNNALAFLRKYRHTLFHQIPVVFCGINDVDPSDLKGLEPVTGVNEAADVKATLKLALQLQPLTEHIIVVNDTTPSGKEVNREIRRNAAEFTDQVDFVYWDALPMEELLRRLTDLKTGDIVLFSFFIRDSLGRFYEYDDSAESITHASPVPVFGLWDFNLGHGIVGGKLVSGYEQGRAVGEMVLRLITGEQVESIPLLMKSPNRFAFDYQELERFGLDPSLLPPESYFINRTISLYERHRVIIWAVCFTLLALSILTIFLLISIVKRRKVEENLRASQQFILGITGNVPGIVFQFYATGEGQYGMSFVSEKSRDILGLDVPLTDFLNSFSKHLHHADKDPFFTSIEQAVKNTSPWHFEGRFLKYTGEQIWFSGRSIPRKKVSDRIVFDGVMLDITEVKNTEEKLRQSEQRMAEIINFLPDPTFVIDTESRVISWNRAIENLTGIKAEDILGKGDYAYALPFHGMRCPVMVDQVLNSDEDIAEKYKNITRQGNLLISESLEPLQLLDNRYFRNVAGPLYDQKGQVAGAIETIHDITRQREAEQEAEASNFETQKNLAFIEAMLSAIPSPVYFKDTQGCFLGCNQAYSDLQGFSNEEIIGKTVHELYPQELAEVYQRKDLELLQNPGFQEYEMQILDKDGVAREAFFAKDVFRDHLGKVAGIVGAFMDISQLKKAEENLRRLQNYLENIVDSMPSILVGVDSDTRVSLWNKQAEKVTGISAEAAHSQPLAQAFPALESEMNNITRALEEQRVVKNPNMKRQDNGGTFYEDITVYPLVADGVQGAVIRVDDVTERVRLEEMMVQGEKMLSLGGLAAGMAHEINNPLAGIVQTAEVLENRLLGDLPANHKAAEAAGMSLEQLQQYIAERKLARMITNIRRSGNRAAMIVKNMLSFARKSDRVLYSHDLGQLLDQTVELAQTDFDLKKEYDFKKIRIIRQYNADTPVPCEGNKLQQVFLNILKNGAEAMAEAAGESEPTFILRVEDESPWVRVEIEDNGPGISEEVRRRIFEPFFTTKAVGNGTGLGLSVSYFIITENHGGRMSVEAQKGQGTRFIMHLPLKEGGHE